MTNEADAIASIVLKEFQGLPKKRKPQVRDNGIQEWVPLSGIVAKHKDGSFKCLALATGMKCLPQSKLPSANGNILHDWHAEVLAIRSFNHFILQECKALAEGRDSLYILRNTDGGNDCGGVDNQRPFIWREDVTIHMYCSEAPCGDASMELTMSAQEDASPWESPLPPHLMERNAVANADNLSSSSSSATPDLLLLGRACFSHLGVVRRKPARPDAPPTLSKSCSDKLALRQCISLLSSVVSLLVSPGGVYLTSLVVPVSQYSETGCERCFSPRGRMASVTVTENTWDNSYGFQPFEIRTTGLEFAFSRRAGEWGEETKYVASNLATAWSSNGLAENIIGGVLQGRKQTDPRGGSAVSREKMWALAKQVAKLAGVEGAVPENGTYQELKEGEALGGRRRVKEDVRADALKGWVRNTGDEGFGLAI